MNKSLLVYAHRCDEGFLIAVKVAWLSFHVPNNGYHPLQEYEVPNPKYNQKNDPKVLENK